MQGIVIQGPTTYFEQIVPAYKDIDNVVWSTWDDEPLGNIEYIKQHMNVVLNKKPIVSGHLNINFQTTSTIGGLYFLKEKGVEEVLKIRGDVLPNNPKLFLQKLKGKQASFLAIAKEGVRKDLYYELVYPHYSHDYPVDLVVYGSIQNMINTFDFLVDQSYPIPPESLIAYNLLEGLRTDFILNYQHFVKNNISFFMNDCIENNIELNWLKNEGVDLVASHNNKQYYEF
jgi:hypothetical protein